MPSPYTLKALCEFAIRRHFKCPMLPDVREWRDKDYSQLLVMEGSSNWNRRMLQATKAGDRDGSE